MKYENLMNHKLETVKGILCFLLNVNSIDGTLIEELAKQWIEDKNLVYKPRSGKVNANVAKFTPELM